MAALFDGVAAREGGLQVVVNCAGFSGFGLITDLDADQFRSVVDVCLTGAFLVIKHAGRHLRDGGSVVSLTSLNARQPAIGMSAYCAAKAGLSMLTEVAALELGPHGIRVNAVAPGFVHTPLTQARRRSPVWSRSTWRTPHWDAPALRRTSPPPWSSCARRSPPG